MVAGRRALYKVAPIVMEAKFVIGAAFGPFHK